ncbi:MAG: HEPN domain-containing protein [Lachnospiraceae bacterium]|nr:HEPN domain-containing protein [Lachnospiraceae bacterium]
MTKDQKLYKSLIIADLKIASDNYDSADKALRLQAAYHAQQAIEKTIKLKAELCGLNLWGHEIDVLIKKCDDAKIKIDIPKLIRDKADMYTQWEAECRYYPVKVVRKDSIKRAIDTVIKWLHSGNTI